MNRSRLLLLLAIPLIFLAATSAQQRPVSKSAQSPADEFAAEMQKLRDTWVQEFNAGHADKLAALYAPEAVLMRWDGSVHGTESILAEFNRSISAERTIMACTACMPSIPAISVTIPARTTSACAIGW